MANTYTSLHYHIVFSTKNRERWITPEVEQRIWAYLGGIAKENKMVSSEETMAAFWFGESAQVVIQG